MRLLARHADHAAAQLAHIAGSLGPAGQQLKVMRLCRRPATSRRPRPRAALNVHPCGPALAAAAKACLLLLLLLVVVEKAAGGLRRRLRPGAKQREEKPMSMSPSVEREWALHLALLALEAAGRLPVAPAAG